MNRYIKKSCSFFGHRNVEATDELKHKVKLIVEDLIINHDVSIFLFGSRSNFDSLCHLVVTELKETFPEIKRVIYTAKSETCLLENEKEKYQALCLHLQELNHYLPCFEEEFEHKTKYSAGKASYVERNQALIDDSDYCIFYYQKNYVPISKKISNCSCYYYLPKSGTAIAYAYANKKKKTLINVALA